MSRPKFYKNDVCLWWVILLLNCAATPQQTGVRKAMTGYDTKATWVDWNPAPVTSWPDTFASTSQPFDAVTLADKSYDDYWALLFVLLDEQRARLDITADQNTALTAAMSVLEGGAARQIDITFVTDTKRKAEGALLRLGRSTDGRIANISVYTEFVPGNAHVWIWLDDGYAESSPMTFRWDANAANVTLQDEYSFSQTQPATAADSFAFAALFDKVRRDFTGQNYVSLTAAAASDSFLPAIWKPVTDRSIDAVFPETQFPPKMTNFPIE